jgi:DNA replication protein DnaC
MGNIENSDDEIFSESVVKEIENEYLQHLDVYSDFIKLSFRDLVSISKDDKEVFLDLYYNRDTEFHDMKSILKNLRNRGNNILITGQAGSGKSSF